MTLEAHKKHIPDRIKPYGNSEGIYLAIAVGDGTVGFDLPPVMARCLCEELDVQLRQAGHDTTSTELEQIKGFRDECERQYQDAKAGLIAAEAQIEELKSKIENFAKGLEAESFDNVSRHLGARMCCDGHMCGCRGATVGEYLAYELRS